MKKGTLLFLACLLLGIGYGCKTDKQSSLAMISLNPDQSKSIELEAISDSISVITLETSDSCLIASVRDLKYYKGLIYVLDSESGKVFLFDQQGKCLRIIADKGQGPDEYISLSGFYVDKKKQCLVLIDNPMKKIHIYSLHGEYVYNKNIDYAIQSVSYLDNGEMLVIRDPVDSQNSFGFRVNVYRRDSLAGQYLPFQYENGATISLKDHPETLCKGGFYYNALNQDTVYKYEGNRFFPCLRVDFGPYAIPEPIKNKSQRERSLAIYDYVRERDYKVANWFSILEEKDNRLLLSYTYDKKLHFGVYDLEKKKITQEFKDPSINGFSFSGIAGCLYENDAFCFIIDTDLLSHCDAKEIEKLKTGNRELYVKIKNLDVDSNPILLICHKHVEI